MNPTKEQLADPKWWDEHAPEGADKYNKFNQMFYRGQSTELQVYSNERWRKARLLTVNQFFTPRPQQPTVWNGEGLPPVGVECEVLWTRATGEYVRAVVVGYDHDNEYAVYRLVSGERGGEYESSRAGDVQGYPCFRPLRTPEQIAAEEREKAVDAMVKVWSRTMGRFAHEERGLAEMLYDAGYRMVEGGAK